MENINIRLEKHIDLLVSRYPVLETIKQDIMASYLVMEECYKRNCKLLVAGNGGSSADSEHIVGELMKKFKIPRPVPDYFAERLKKIDPIRGEYLSCTLERGLRALSLTAHEALSTAYINDVGAVGVYAQQLYVLGRPGDVFMGISTSGDSKNIINAAVVAHAVGMKVIGLIGDKGGEFSKVADISIKVPGNETYMVQELHLPVYHCLCLMLEDRFFGENNRI